MARSKKTSTPTLKSWDEVNEGLRKYRICEIELALIDAEMNIATTAIKEQAENQAASYKAEMEGIKATIEEFVDFNLADLDGKSKKFTFGKIGFRQSSKITWPTKKTDAVLHNLKQLGMDDCIKRPKETIDREILAKYSDDTIAKAGASRKIKDNFFLETDKEQLNP